MPKLKHVEGLRGSAPTHGHTLEKRRSPEFYAWDNMMQRCFNKKNPSYKNYGGRGITVAPALQDFFRFLEEVGPRPSPGLTLERKNNERGYEPGNLHWATRKKQQRNTRRCRMLTFNDKTQSLPEWAEEKGIERGTLASRLRYGWSLERALTPTLVKSGRPRLHPRQNGHP